VDIDVQIGGMEFLYWLAKIGKSRATGYRWRAEGRLHTVNIDGKLFITQHEIDRFWTRAKAGEFSKQPHGACAPEPAA
jgi:predicted site-specific integrase-resolvase